MTNDLVEKTSSYVTRYETGAEDPYAAFANEHGPGIKGKLLTCSKGDWAIGKDKDPVKADAQFLFIVSETMRGWLRWGNNVVTAADMGYVRDNFQMKHRSAFGEEDKTQWEKTPDGEPRDPWTRAYRALLLEMSPPHGEVTFAGSSWGADTGLKEICLAYSQDKHRYPDAFPVVKLSTKTRPNKRYGGNKKDPYFEIVGWASVEDVKAGKKNGKKAKVPTKAETEKAIDDTLDDPVPESWSAPAA